MLVPGSRCPSGAPRGGHLLAEGAALLVVGLALGPGLRAARPAAQRPATKPKAAAEPKAAAVPKAAAEPGTAAAPRAVTAPRTATPPRAAAVPPWTLLLSARLGVWPLWMAANWERPHPVPPFVELSFGLKHRWFELGLHAGVALGDLFDPPGTVIGLGLSASFYSLRRARVRLRHSIATGVLSDAVFRRRPQPVAALPMPTARLSLLDIFVRLAPGWWLEIAPLTFGWPLGYELALGIRHELSSPGSRRSTASPEAPPPTGPRGRQESRSRPTPPATSPAVRVFVGFELGLGWWHHHEPPVVGNAFGRIGLRYGWLEVALGVGSPAWAKWRARGLYELFVDVGFSSLERGRLRLVHQARLGWVMHNPPFETHELGLAVHVDFCVIALRLVAGLWAELKPLTLSIAPRDQLSTGLGLRYEL